MAQVINIINFMGRQLLEEVEEGATTPVLFGTLEEALTRIGKHERWQYGKERAETRVEAIENAVFEMLTEINKAILGARQVTRQVENFYAGK